MAPISVKPIVLDFNPDCVHGKVEYNWEASFFESSNSNHKHFLLLNEDDPDNEENKDTNAIFGNVFYSTDTIGQGMGKSFKGWLIPDPKKVYTEKKPFVKCVNNSHKLLIRKRCKGVLICSNDECEVVHPAINKFTDVQMATMTHKLCKEPHCGAPRIYHSCPANGVLCSIY